MVTIRKVAEKIHPIFERMEWEWGGGHIPSVRDIEDKIRELIRHLDVKASSVSSGRIFVERVTNPHASPYYEVGVYVSMGELEEADVR